MLGGRLNILRCENQLRSGVALTPTSLNLIREGKLLIFRINKRGYLSGLWYKKNFYLNWFEVLFFVFVLFFCSKNPLSSIKLSSWCGFFMTVFWDRWLYCRLNQIYEWEDFEKKHKLVFRESLNWNIEDMTLKFFTHFVHRYKKLLLFELFRVYLFYW